LGARDQVSARQLVRRDQPWADRLILLAFMVTSFLGLPAVAALDVFRRRPPSLA
jgi:hypothetical protein